MQLHLTSFGGYAAEFARVGYNFSNIRSQNVRRLTRPLCRLCHTPHFAQGSEKMMTKNRVVIVGEALG